MRGQVWWRVTQRLTALCPGIDCLGIRPETWLYCTVSLSPSWKLSGVGILDNKARGPRALLANIPTPFNFQLGNTGSISHLTSRNRQQISLKTGLGNTKKRTG